MTRVTFRLPDSIHERAKLLAKRDGALFVGEEEDVYCVKEEFRFGRGVVFSEDVGVGLRTHLASAKAAQNLGIDDARLEEFGCA